MRVRVRVRVRGSLGYGGMGYEVWELSTTTRSFLGSYVP